MEFSVLLGKTLISIENIENQELVFKTLDGLEFKLYHEQDCCESVAIEEIHGSLDDLLNEELLVAEEVDNENYCEKQEDKCYDDSVTWTFYKLKTMHGDVTIRWCGESNGYYSESVSFCQVKKI